MSPTSPPTNEAIVASLRRLWRRMRILQGLVVLLIALACVQTWMLYDQALGEPVPVAVDGFKPPLPEDERPPADEAFAETMQKRADHSAEIFSRARVPFSTDDIDAMARQQVPWLTSFVDAQGLDEDTSQQLAELLSEHMHHVNEVRLAEFRGAHSPKDTAQFVKVERSRLARALLLVLGTDSAAEVERLMDEHLPYQGGNGMEE